MFHLIPTEAFLATPATPKLAHRLGAEALGTFWLVFGGAGSAVLAAKFVGDDMISVGIGHLGVSLAFGLTVLTMAYAVGHVSGGHFNPAVTIGLAAAKRFEWKDVLPYILTQVVAGTAGAGVLWLIASGAPDFEACGFASNGYDALSPGGFSLIAVLIAEVVLTAFFLYIILGATDRRAPVGFAPIAIGFSLALIHLISIPVSNTSVNPARSTATAIFAGGDYVGQLWLFWLAPIVGAAIAGITYSIVTGVNREALDVSGEAEVDAK
ncbi:aquaporin Z [Gulosibacter macacae]|uniref:Aquaporin Z n=1 Tax=Gulosibacter macacae TaxID=2488791 RepID=A0A3P3W1J7_9MICO|nr:aquaporin Z [Gulosibacter macacae]RRJ88850.1 aquaporin Z [Gulosibacter macacae]